ncbi:MAG: thymidylate synthase (FAD) [Thermoplasmata archaeon HGW-Thermoplasmata-1]|nr:MAG: thymidylate synthase (FAD) [Thermoplasmata archaeon HGW-Thermoplasmata-1]
MNVELITATPEGELVAALAAALTHSDMTPEKLKEERDEGKLTALLGRVMKMGHTSVAEHVSFTFAVSGVSRSLTHQLVRHRIASYSQQSQRYVSLSQPSYVTPPKIGRDERLRGAYGETMARIWAEYNKLLSLGIPAEDARYVLPNGSTTNIIVTMNARALLNFFELRCCNHAQWEIRELAWKMLNLVREAAPTIFSEAGPACVTKGYCPEHDTGCPRYPKKSEKGEE